MDPVVEWDVPRVIRWFHQNGFPGYKETLKENSIDGEVLINLDHESLRDLGIRALGKRLLVLKSIYFLKLQHDVPITSESYVPQTVDVEPDDNMAGPGTASSAASTAGNNQRKYRRQTDETMARLLEEVSALSQEMATVRSDMQRIYRLSILENKPLPPDQTRRSNYNDQFANTVAMSRGNKNVSNPEDPSSAPSRRGGGGPSTPMGVPQLSSLSTAPVAASPGPGGTTVSTFANPLVASSNSAQTSSAATGNSGGGASSLLLPSASGAAGMTGTIYSPSTANQTTPVTPHIRVYGDNALQRENEAYKSFRISVDDPCSTILPHALKKYHISDDWHNYTLCIQYGGNHGTPTTGSTARGKVERALALDDKPLHMFQQLKDAGESPVFVLKKRASTLGASFIHQNRSSNSVYKTSNNGSFTSLFSNNNGSASSLELTQSNGVIVSSAAAVPSSPASHDFEKI